MSTTSTTGRLGAPPSTHSVRRVTAAGASIAALVNTALWLGGRAADVSFRARPAMADSDLTVGIIEIVLTTVVMVVLGSWVLVRAARRSPSRARAVLVAAAVFAVLSVMGPLTTAVDTSTGALLAAMHLATGAVSLLSATRLRAATAR